MQAIIVRLIKVHPNNIVFTLKISFFLHKITYYPHFLYYFFISIISFFFYFLCFSIYSKTIKKMSINEIKDLSILWNTIIKELNFLKKKDIIQ